MRRVRDRYNVSDMVVHCTSFEDSDKMLVIPDTIRFMQVLSRSWRPTQAHSFDHRLVLSSRICLAS